MLAIRTHSARSLRTWALTAALAMTSLLAPSQSHAAGGAGRCQALTIPVALAPGHPAHDTIYGELCLPPNATSRVVQLLVPGGTYSHLYWDFPYQRPRYSYVRALTAAGYSTFNIDLIATGRSSHPSSALVTADALAYALHQVVQGLRAGHIGGIKFTRVVIVGHSLGSLVATIEAGAYHDVDGVILTALLHRGNSKEGQALVASFYPATLDPRFAGRSLDQGYLTTRSGTRGRSFYDVSSADPVVIATDEATKDTATTAELSGFGELFRGISARITAPVLTVVGQRDAINCAPPGSQDGADCSSAAAIRQEEAPFYSTAAVLQAAVIPSTGHDLNLHETAPTWFAVAINWSYQHVAPWS